jgi:hypothetical protein
MARELVTVKTVYEFDELSEAAKQKAIESYRVDYPDHEWWDSTYEMIEQAATILGINLKQKPVKLMNGSTRYDPSIYFSGFYHQGSGSSFDGVYRYSKGCVAAIKKEFPSDEKLHAIAADLVAVQKKEAYRLEAAIKSNGDNWISVEVDLDGDTWADLKDGSEEGIKEALRDFNAWIYKSLESEYEYLTSDEAITETIEANEYEFTEDGMMV